ncbi:MAG: hypothetical protein AAF226_13925, partial [Verrucomicrobiota bacterium]
MKRIESLDLIRGVAICGLAPINILDFAYSNELYFLAREGDGEWFWAVITAFGAGKFISLFSLLFGAGLFLQTQGFESSGRDVVKSYFPRLGWLALFGSLHALFIWHGDILLSYALVGMLVYCFRRMSSKKLAWIGGATHAVFSFLAVLICVGVGFAFDHLGLEEGLYAGMGVFSPESMSEGYFRQLPFRFINLLSMLLGGIIIFVLPLSGSLMLLGMALIKTGFFQGIWSKGRYLKWGGISALIGIAAGLGGIYFSYLA